MGCWFREAIFFSNGPVGRGRPRSGALTERAVQDQAPGLFRLLEHTAPAVNGRVNSGHANS